MPEKPPNILVTGVGALIGYGIINSFKQGRHKPKLVGMDIYADAYGGRLANEFVQAVRADAPEYPQFIKDTINRYEIDLIVPGIEQDLYRLHALGDEISGKTRVVMNNDLCIGLSRDKWLTYTYLKERKVSLIPTLMGTSYRECVDQLSSPFLIKPVHGYASKGIQIISNEREFDFYTQTPGKKFICQRIVGSIESEYTVSVFGDGKGGYFDHIVLLRRLSQEGATSKAVLIENHETIMSYVSGLCRLLTPVGPTNIQVRLEGEVPYLLEINPRISSACSIRTAMGYNEPDMCVDYFLLGREPVVHPKRRASAIRFIGDQIDYE
jgi:carbamoyl-phosphate synthase large subunit